MVRINKLCYLLLVPLAIISCLFINSSLAKAQKIGTNNKIELYPHYFKQYSKLNSYQKKGFASGLSYNVPSKYRNNISFAQGYIDGFKNNLNNPDNKNEIKALYSYYVDRGVVPYQKLTGQKMAKIFYLGKKINNSASKYSWPDNIVKNTAEYYIHHYHFNSFYIKRFKTAIRWNNNLNKTNFGNGLYKKFTLHKLIKDPYYPYYIRGIILSRYNSKAYKKMIKNFYNYLNHKSKPKYTIKCLTPSSLKYAIWDKIYNKSKHQIIYYAYLSTYTPNY